MTELKSSNPKAPRLLSVDYVNGKPGSFIDVLFRLPKEGNPKHVGMYAYPIGGDPTFHQFMITEVGQGVYSGRVQLNQVVGTSMSYSIAGTDDDVHFETGDSMSLDLAVTRLSYSVSNAV